MRRELLAHPGSAPRPGEDGPPVLGVPAAELVGQAHHQVGHRLRGQEHLVAPGRAAPTAGPPRPVVAPVRRAAPPPRRRRSPWCRPRPRSSRCHRRCGPPSAGPPGVGRGPAGCRWTFRDTRWSGGVRRIRPVHGRTGGPGRTHRDSSPSTPDSTDSSVASGGASNRPWEPGATSASPGTEQREASSAAGEPDASCSAAFGQSTTSTSPPRRATPAADASLDLTQADHRHPPVPSAAVGGGGVVGVADLDLAGLLHDHHAVVAVGSGRGQGPLHHVLGRAGVRPRPSVGWSPTRLLAGVEHPDTPYQHRGASVGDRCHLSGLSLAAVERSRPGGRSTVPPPPPSTPRTPWWWPGRRHPAPGPPAGHPRCGRSADR